MAAASFHWIDEAVRLAKPAPDPAAGGRLAVVDTHHVSAGGTAAFFADAQRCYEAWDPDARRICRPPGSRTSRSIGRTSRRRSSRGELRRYVEEVSYSTDDYIRLLLTYSGHLALADHLREGLLGCLAALIDGRYGGSVAKQYLFELRWRHVR